MPMRQTRDKDIPGMYITMNTIFMPGHTRLHASRRNKNAMLDDKHIGILSELILCAWSSIKAEVQKDLQPFLAIQR